MSLFHKKNLGNELNDTMDETSSPSSSLPATTAVAILLARSAGGKTASADAGTARIAVSARIPRKRTHNQDPIQSTLKHWVFLDDKRLFTNVDALLTRLAPIRVVHVACTESAEGDKNKANSASTRRADQVSDLLTKLSTMIQSRTDIMASFSMDQGDQQQQQQGEEEEFTNVLASLPSELHDISRIDSILLSLVNGDEGSEAHLAYRGNVRLQEGFVKKAMGLLLYGEQIWTHQEDEIVGTFEIVEGVMDSHMALDRTASECINLLPPPNAGVASFVGGRQTNNSLFGVLNRCLTRMGSRTLEGWLRQPLINLQEIQSRQTVVAALVQDGIGRDRLRDEGLAGLAGVDLDKVCGKLSQYRTDVIGSTSAALELLYKIYMLSYQQIPNLCATLNDLVQQQGATQSPSSNGTTDNAKDENGCAMRKTLHGLETVLTDLANAKALVEAVLDMDQAPRNFMVRSSQHEELGDIKKELDVIDAELEDCHERMNQTWADVSGAPVGQVRLDDSGEASAMQFRLPNANDIKILQHDLANEVMVHRTLKNGVYFSTTELRQLGTKKQDLMEEYDKHQRQIVVQAMQVSATFVPVLERASVLVAELDVLASLAYVAAYSPTPYVRPEMTDGEEDGLGIELKDARHPCVELQESVDFIPNDISLVFGASSFLLVTGPNMGGKSTYIRSLGAIVTMAQIGSFVPCTSAKINIVHHILARVGAGDAQDRGISTFMAEMLEASSILRTASKRSLIVIDELGRGTSTFDGYGLATAISEYIVQRLGCMTVFATHFHELTALEDREAAVSNCHVTAQRATDGSNGLTFLYEVRPGPCLESFGIQVAEMAHVPSAVIADAKRKAKQLENFDYRKKMRKDGEEEVDDESKMEDNEQNEHADAEQAAADLEFVHRFKKLPLNSFKTDEEKMAALKALLQ
mmetsp:Transcript_7713/g.11036  ORF Transcript_7713/g.11036 Transcript_7713/m.11036 type:complete len:922 (-) Transcript_7713:55-2820(-)